MKMEAAAKLRRRWSEARRAEQQAYRMYLQNQTPENERHWMEAQAATKRALQAFHQTVGM